MSSHLGNPPEREKRRRMLVEVHRRVFEAQAAGESYASLLSPDFEWIGAEMGLNRTQTVGLFNGLVAEGYVRLFHPSDTVLGDPTIQLSWVESLTDKGLIAIGRLPDVHDRLIAAFERIRSDEERTEAEKTREIAWGEHAIDFLKALAARGAGDALIKNLPI